MRLTAVASLAFVIAASAIPVSLPIDPKVPASVVPATSNTGLTDGKPGAAANAIGTAAGSIHLPRSVAGSLPVNLTGLSGAISGAGSQTESLTGLPITGTNTGSAAGLLHGAADAGGTSGNGNLADVANLAGALPSTIPGIPGSSFSATGAVGGAVTYLQSAANGGPSGAGQGGIAGAVTGALGPLSASASGFGGSAISA